MEFEEQIKSRWHFDKEEEFLEKGLEKGRAEGRVEGVARGVDMVLKLLKKGYSEAQIREAVLKADDMPNSSTQQS
jgi:predicted transposase YdaD